MSKYALEKGAGRGDADGNAGTQHEEQFVIARKMREALIKAGSIGGLPKVWFITRVQDRHWESDDDG